VKHSQSMKCSVLLTLFCVFLIFITFESFWISVPTVLAGAYQEKGIADSAPYLSTSPSQLSSSNYFCKTNDNQSWICTVLLYGHNAAINWVVFTSNSSVIITPNSGLLDPIDSPIRKITISNIPCININFLFSGQVYGGVGGVIPASLPWSCTPKPTPSPSPTRQPTPILTSQSTPVPPSQPSPTSKIVATSATPAKTTIPKSTPTMKPTIVVSSASQSITPNNGNSDPSANMFIFSALIVVTLVAMMELVIIVKMRRMIM
jgi:hypothetical protein